MQLFDELKVVFIATITGVTISEFEKRLFYYVGSASCLL